MIQVCPSKLHVLQAWSQYEAAEMVEPSGGGSTTSPSIRCLVMACEGLILVFPDIHLLIVFQQ
jgi:hypothetical protein